MLRAGLISAASSSANLGKNRYSNIFPLDAARVVLKTSPRTDYINASYITLPRLESLKVIAGQGPTHPDYHGENTCGEHAVPSQPSCTL